MRIKLCKRHDARESPKAESWAKRNVIKFATPPDTVKREYNRGKYTNKTTQLFRVDSAIGCRERFSWRRNLTSSSDDWISISLLFPFTIVRPRSYGGSFKDASGGNRTAAGNSLRGSIDERDGSVLESRRISRVGERKIRHRECHSIKVQRTGEGFYYTRIEFWKRPSEIFFETAPTKSERE